MERSKAKKAGRKKLTREKGNALKDKPPQKAPAKEAIKQVGMVVEGLNALPAAIKLKDKYNVEMPIITMVNEVVNNRIDPKEAVIKLMSREKKEENLISSI